MLVHEHTTCRVCGGSFRPLLDLGMLVLPAYLKPTDQDPERAPLDLVMCDGCQLVQLRHSVENDRLYREYWYQSGINEAMVKELTDVATCALNLVQSDQRKTWLDVGANDGTLLRIAGEWSGQKRPYRIAVEPSHTFTGRLQEHTEIIIRDYFPSATRARLDDASIDVVTSVAMFYDVDDPLRFVQEVDRLLSPNGVWIVQMQDLAQMVAATAFDNVCFEHRVYYSTATFQQLLTGCDLEIRAVETRAINGGSLRYYITRKASTIRCAHGRSLQDQLVSEAWLTSARLSRFAVAVCERKRALVATICECARVAPVDLYAASTKSSTLLQYCGIDHRLLRYAVERSPEKVGLVTSGTRIPIISEEQWHADPAPVLLLSAWGFKDVMIKREAAYIRNGGQIIVPLPKLQFFPETVRAQAKAS